LKIKELWENFILIKKKVKPKRKSFKQTSPSHLQLSKLRYWQRYLEILDIWNWTLGCLQLYFCKLEDSIKIL